MASRISTTTLAGPVLALDLGGTNARAAVVTPDGRVSARRARATPMAEGVPAVLGLCLEPAAWIRAEHVAGRRRRAHRGRHRRSRSARRRARRPHRPAEPAWRLVGLSAGAHPRRSARPALGHRQGHQREHPRRARLRRRPGLRRPRLPDHLDRDRRRRHQRRPARGRAGRRGRRARAHDHRHRRARRADAAASAISRPSRRGRASPTPLVPPSRQAPTAASSPGSRHASRRSR